MHINVYIYIHTHTHKHTQIFIYTHTRMYKKKLITVNRSASVLIFVPGLGAFGNQTLDRMRVTILCCEVQRRLSL